MTEFSGVGDNSSDFDGNTILLECKENQYIYDSGLDIFQLKTDGKVIAYISLMGNNMCPYAVMIRKKIHISYQIITNFLKITKSKK